MWMLSFGTYYLLLAVCTSKNNLVVTLEEELEHYHTLGTVPSHPVL